MLQIWKTPITNHVKVTCILLWLYYVKWKMVLSRSFHRVEILVRYHGIDKQNTQYYNPALKFDKFPFYPMSEFVLSPCHTFSIISHFILPVYWMALILQSWILTCVLCISCPWPNQLAGIIYILITMIWNIQVLSHRWWWDIQVKLHVPWDSKTRHKLAELLHFKKINFPGRIK